MATFGAALKRAREQRGVSLDEIAADTRLSKRYLLALEDEAISKLPGGTYNRAYLRSYAAFLGLDPEALVRDYAREEARQTQLAEADQLAAMTRAIEQRAAASGGGTTRAREVLATPAGITAVAVLAFAVVGGVVWFGLSGFQQAARDRDVAATDVLDPAAAPRSASPAQAPAATPAQASESAGASVSASSPAATANTAVASNGAASSNGAATPNSAPASSPATSPSSTALPGSRASAPPAAPSAPAAEPQAAPAVAPAVPDRVTTPTTPSPLPAGHDIVRVADTRGQSRLTVAGSGVGTGVIERQLVGQADRFAVGSKVVFWTHVRGGRAGDTIDHVWFRDGTIVGAASLAVGSPDWRTQSRRLLDPSGVWVVEARDAEGHVLARHEFQAAP